jgi:hypothetical protein
MLDLNPHTWADMLKSDDIEIMSEERIFNAVISYVHKFDKKQRNEALEIILPSIRFPLLSPQFLFEKVEQNRDINQLPILKELMLETYR